MSEAQDAAMFLESDDGVAYRGAKSPRTSKLLIAFVVLFVVFLVIAVVFIALYAVEKAKSGDEAKGTAPAYARVCGSKGCLETAVELMKQLNRSVDPCEDFYQFACGGWMNENALKEGETSLVGFSLLSDKIKNVLNKTLQQAPQTYADNEAVMKTVSFYDSCLDMSAVNRRGGEPLQKLIEDFGGWNVTASNMTSLQKETIFNRIAKVSRELGVKPLFAVHVGADPHDSHAHILQFGSAPIGMASEHYHANTTNSLKMRTSYRTLMKAIAHKLGGGADAERQMEEVYEFEKQLAEIETRTQSAVLFKTLRRAVEAGMLLFDLRTTIDKFSVATDIPVGEFTAFFDALFKDQGLTFKASDKVLAYPVEYYQHLFTLYNNQTKAPPVVIVNYIMWTVVRTFVPALSEDYLEIYQEFRSAAYGNSTSERWESCIGTMQNYMKMPMGLLFVNTAFDDQSKSALEEMTHYVRDAFLKNLDQNSWMSDFTKGNARTKAKGIREDIGYPAFIKDKAKLNAMYKDVSYGDQFFENVLAARRFTAQKSLSSYTKPVDKDEWYMSPSQVNGYYAPRQNRIVFLAGILQNPFYNKKFPNYLNYGGIGMVIGHEITHGFDGSGRLFDKDGNIRDWWSVVSNMGFHTRSKCLADQYSKYEVFGKKINGNLTLDENIADNGGLKIAHQAYKDWVEQNAPEGALPGLEMTVDQLFYVGFARPWCSIYTKEPAYTQLLTDSHSFPMYRVIGTVQNDPEFSKAFNCKPGSKMNPKNKCALW